MTAQLDISALLMEPSHFGKYPNSYFLFKNLKKNVLLTINNRNE